MCDVRTTPCSTACNLLELVPVVSTADSESKQTNVTNLQPDGTLSIACLFVITLCVCVCVLGQIFQLATATHHLIYSGTLMLHEARQLTPIFAVLMTDLLLLTRPDPDNGSLVVLTEPWSLQDIVGSCFKCSHRELHNLFAACATQITTTLFPRPKTCCV